MSVKFKDICDCTEPVLCTKLSQSGKVNYVSPEIITNKITYNQIYKIDVWALGVLMFKWITDRFPFDSKFINQIFVHLIIILIP